MSFKARSLDDSLLPYEGTLALFEDASEDSCHRYGDDLVLNGSFEAPMLDQEWALMPDDSTRFFWQSRPLDSVCKNKEPVVELRFQDQGSLVNQFVNLRSSCTGPQPFIENPNLKPTTGQIELSQGFAATKGKVYFLEFDYKRSDPNDGTPIPYLETKFGQEFFKTRMERNGWQKFSRLVRASENFVTLSIKSTKGSTHQVSIDNVSVRSYSNCNQRLKTCRRISSIVSFNPGANVKFKRPEATAKNNLINKKKAQIIGAGGSIVIKMDRPIANIPGYDFIVKGTSKNKHFAQVFVSEWPEGPWNFVGFIEQDAEIDFSPLKEVSYIKIENPAPTPLEPQPKPFYLRYIQCLK